MLHTECTVSTYAESTEWIDNDKDTIIYFL